MTPSEVMPDSAGGAGTVFDWLEKKKRTISTKTIDEPERDQQLVLVRAAVEMADDDPLHHARRPPA